MESLCYIRNIYRLISKFEEQLQQKHELSLNEGMVLCELKNASYSSGEIANLVSLTHSNTSKVIAALEKKQLVTRIIGDTDKRKMFFSITPQGTQKVNELLCEESEIQRIAKNIESDILQEK
ncbi:MAG: MarR family transcriptional regulator [Bacteroidales bacterium]|jgi:DNA-binding MarR family transcriptional regulator|nr:MarR family transcriptional regulator [Paludibacteraceae bacterium]MBP8628444.1 MarR family transcriptional regulator [Paludibacteraceae bacterium]NLK91644.1 MarR family transcriptional regulator [Bacteroidales bacterium]HNZ85363.1 MarR family transcriptional regulator [Paludibacteraceae bacterium]